MKQTVFALIDCNNFFVSCERLFRPDLEGRPVVVLSSNDGCAVSRSNEAKALGIPMGAPAFKYLQIFKMHNVAQFSANFELYGDISARITNLLLSITPHTEVYSVDESFLDLSELDITDYREWGQQVRQLILQYVGIPVSIGIAPTKTLAKLGAERAKKDADLSGVLSIGLGETTDDDMRLAATPVGDIWGVGWRLTPKLKAEGVHTAYDLKHFSIKRASQLMGVHGRQLVTELQGTSCLPLQLAHKPQQQIMRGRQFGNDTNELSAIQAAVGSLTAKAAVTLRHERLLARQAAITIRTNRHKPGYVQRTKVVKFAMPTADTGIIAAALMTALRDTLGVADTAAVWDEVRSAARTSASGGAAYAKANQSTRLQHFYHKADVTVFDLIPQHALQTDLLGEVVPQTADRSQARLAAVDALNAKFGPNHVRYASQDLSQAWRPRHNLGSPAYTSKWDELPTIRT